MFDAHQSRHLPYLDRNYSHSPQDLRQLDTPSIDPGFDGPFRDLEYVDDLLVTQLFDVAEYHARLKICRKLIYTVLNLGRYLAAFHLAFGRVSNGSQVVLMVVHRIGHRILRISLPMAVIVDYQIAGKPHKPICKVALLWRRTGRAFDRYE